MHRHEYWAKDMTQPKLSKHIKKSLGIGFWVHHMAQPKTSKLMSTLSIQTLLQANL